MADRFYNVPLGGKLPQDVAEGASDTSVFGCVRLTYDAPGNSKQEALNAIIAVHAYISCLETWPPA